MSPRGPRKPPEQTPGQLDMFTDTSVSDVAPAAESGASVPAPRSSSETNDLDLVRDVAGNAARGLYVLVGASERVYARDGAESDTVMRVPAYEAHVVHQLLHRGWLTLGAQHTGLSCGAATLTGTAVSCPKATRARLARWEALARPTTWNPPPPATSRPRLRAVPTPAKGATP